MKSWEKLRLIFFRKTLTLYYLFKIGSQEAKDRLSSANEDEKYQVLIKKIYVLENLIYMNGKAFFQNLCADSYPKEKAET